MSIILVHFNVCYIVGVRNIALTSISVWRMEVRNKYTEVVVHTCVPQLALMIKLWFTVSAVFSVLCFKKNPVHRGLKDHGVMFK